MKSVLVCAYFDPLPQPSPRRTRRGVGIAFLVFHRWFLHWLHEPDCGTHVDCAAIKPRRKSICGARCGPGVLPDSNFTDNILSENISWILSPPQLWIELDGFKQACRNSVNVMKNGKSFSRQKELKRCAFGIISGKRIATVSCWKSGTHCIGERVAWRSCGRCRTIVMFRRRLSS